MVIAELRHMTGLTQTDLGNLTNIPQKRIGYIERGERPIWLGEFIAIINALEKVYPDGLRELFRRLPLVLKQFVNDELKRFDVR